MKTWIAAVLAVAACLLIYAGALSAQFVGDDFMILHRLREAGGVADAWRFFRGEFFDYYRPMGFVVHAIDWSLAGASARQFHLTNILLHAASSVLVLLIGRELSPRTIAGPAAALLFAWHASSHEAVVWISARFDLLATLFSLFAVWRLLRRPGDPVTPALVFLAAILSKEAAVAMPVAAAGYAVFVRRDRTVDAVKRVAPWLVALLVYSVLRNAAGGIPALGGASRLPKLAVFAVLLAVVLAFAGGRWLRARAWLQTHRGAAIAALGAGVLIASCIALAGVRVIAEKLAVAGFAVVNLASPWIDLFDFPFYLQPGTAIYWLGGTIALAFTLCVLAALWPRLVGDDRMWFLAAFLAAALLPISALTEGTRYLYLPSAAIALIGGVLLGELQGRGRSIAATALALYLAISAAQVLVKVRDWQWAGTLTAEGARMVDAALAPACGDGHVVFLTEPVAIRSVYTHFLYETFEIPRGCMPAVFQNMTRILRVDTTMQAAWDGPARIVITIPDYRGNLSLSGDLRHFDPPLPAGSSARLRTPLGELQAGPDGRSLKLTLAIDPAIDAARVRWFYYSDGAMRPLPK